MIRLLTVILATGICLYGFAGYGKTLSIHGISSEIESAFLDKQNTINGQDNSTGQAPGRATTDVTRGKVGSSMNGEQWRKRLEAILDIPKAPLPGSLELEMLEVSGAKFIVAVYDTGEEGLVHRTREIIWPKVKMLFNKGRTPVLHIVPVSGGTFGAGKMFYTIMNESNGFNVFYILLEGAPREVSLAFSDSEGTFLTPDGFICRIRKHVSVAEGKE